MTKGSVLLNSIRIQNMRSLKDTGDIPLRPLTLLVGGNSSGKSTFLRTFPLIKQSINKHTAGPILWAGDVDDYVDFGSFKETKGPNGKSIDLSFSFDIENNTSPLISAKHLNRLSSQLPICKVNYSISIHQRPNRCGAGEEVSVLKVVLNNTSYVITSSHSSNKPYTITVDSSPISLLNCDVNNSVFSSNISHLLHYFARPESIFHFKLPNLDFIWKSLESFIFSDINNSEYLDFSSALIFLSMAFLYIENPLEFIKQYCLKFEKANTPSDSEIKNFYSFLNDFTRKFTNAESNLQQEIQQGLLLFYLYYRIAEIEEYIKQYFKHTHYIAPLRATAERFYRLRNLAVDEVDFQGKNMAVFLNSLSKDQLEAFQNWTKKYFGFVILLVTKMQHISVKIARDRNSQGVNISDSGFGYSQILPIIAELWFLSNKSNNRSASLEPPTIIAIEQPELHLHPALQAELVDAFIACVANAKEHGHTLQLIIETHSETIVNRLGRCIARKKISADSAQIVLFEKPYGQNQTQVEIATYNEDGMLKNWPIGFFEPEGI